MQLDKLKPAYLFETHSKGEIIKWATNLHYFYFIRAWGGHANDGDRFEAVIKYADRQDLINKLAKLDISFQKIPEDYPEPIVGKAYSTNEFETFKNSIKDFRDLEQPGNTCVKGIKCFIWIESGEILFSISGTDDNNPYNVSNADFESCKSLERIFDANNFKDVKGTGIERQPNCVSESNYPNLFT
jgi:hypothetical protein